MEQIRELDRAAAGLANSFVEAEAQKIKAELVGVHLFGQEMDLTDIDTLMVAAYYLGRRSARWEYNELGDE